jgi:hypothetical protein
LIVLWVSCITIISNAINEEVHVVDLLYGLIGIVLLTLGRKLFWLFVGCVGFVAGLQMAQQYFGLQPAWVAWASALLFGLVGALLALFFQKLAIVLGGFAAGSTISAHLTFLVGLASTPVINVLGGLAGAILLYVLFDWALIVLSSVVGSTLVVQSLPWNAQIETVLYLVLIAAGICFQAAWLHVQKPKSN